VETSLPSVILRARRAKPLFGRHPWLYAGAIETTEGDPGDGAEVNVFSHGGNFVARGFYNSNSRVRVRLYTWNLEERLDEAFFRRKLSEAIQLRRDTLGWFGPGKACRLVFSEGDGLSGLTIDAYDRWLVVQFTSLAMAQRREMFAQLLRELTAPEGIYLRTERGIGQLEGLELEDGPLWGNVPSTPIVIEEKGLEFLVNLAEGQKTGSYLDQRENRAAAARYAKGRRVLDAFCYSGGFGLHAARAGAAEVLGIDSSAPGLDLARQNAERNRLANVSFAAAEVFDYLESAVRERQRFQMIVLDPPKFARKQEAVEKALAGYRRLQSLALMLLDPDGILVTCCCSGLIDMAMLEALLAQVATKTGRNVQILERRYQPADHPVAATCLDSSYLKCLIARVT
jgi:23S rRNA (cytosine1962-C5)-methyltransferase